mmetsp:Transcript_30502/g.69387  ORF Transcript_30502/g.69387 Transcript_30502/m.69387 type:complete len:105 (+) Transcript_30502:57-371(+)
MMSSKPTKFTNPFRPVQMYIRRRKVKAILAELQRTSTDDARVQPDKVLMRTGEFAIPRRKSMPCDWSDSEVDSPRTIRVRFADDEKSRRHSDSSVSLAPDEVEL